MPGLRHVPRALISQVHQQPEGISGVVMGEGDGIKEEERMITTEEAMEKIIIQLDHVIKTANQRTTLPRKQTQRNNSKSCLAFHPR